MKMSEKDLWEIPDINFQIMSAIIQLIGSDAIEADLLKKEISKRLGVSEELVDSIKHEMALSKILKYYGGRDMENAEERFESSYYILTENGIALWRFLIKNYDL
jgi:AraC-like DNA-binding protein